MAKKTSEGIKTKKSRGPYKKKPRTQVDTTSVSFFHVKTFFFIFIFGLLFLFYPGRSFYIDLFAQNPELFDVTEKQSNSYDIKPIPYVKQGVPSPAVSARSVYVMELASATPVFERNKDLKVFPASTTKVITALTAMDVYGMDEVLEVKRLMTVGQTVDFALGEKLTFESILYGTLIHSGNDAAYVLADNYPGGYDSFMTAMNRKAQSLGMTNSSFKNPAGLDESGQTSTAFDLALAGRKLLENKDLAKIVSTKSITINDVSYTYFHPLYNINALLGEIPGVAGLKTGKTELAGENLITLYKHQDREYLIVLLGSIDRFEDTRQLVTWINTNVQYLQP